MDTRDDSGVTLVTPATPTTCDVTDVTDGSLGAGDRGEEPVVDDISSSIATREDRKRVTVPNKTETTITNSGRNNGKPVPGPGGKHDGKNVREETTVVVFSPARERVVVEQEPGGKKMDANTTGRNRGQQKGGKKASSRTTKAKGTKKRKAIGIAGGAGRGGVTTSMTCKEGKADCCNEAESDIRKVLSWQPYERSRQKTYRDEAQKGSCSDGAVILKNRWCRLCKEGDPADLLTLGTVDDQKNVFYAPKERLAAGGACHMCFGKAIISAPRGRQSRRAPERHRNG